MAVNRDWVPKQIDKFKIFADNLCKKAKDNAGKWQLDAGEVASLLVLRAIFNRYYRISSIKNTHSVQDTENTKGARKNYQKALRTMGIKRMKNNPYMTDSDRFVCGLNNNAYTHTLSPVADTSPLIDFNNNGDLGGKIVCIDPKSHKACKPEGQDGIWITFGFHKAGKAIPPETDCTLTIQLSKCHGKVVFPQKYKGMPFVAYARYYNTREILGLVATQFFGTVC